MNLVPTRIQVEESPEAARLCPGPASKSRCLTGELHLYAPEGIVVPLPPGVSAAYIDEDRLVLTPEG